MFKMPTAVAALFVAALMVGPACSNSGQTAGCDLHVAAVAIATLGLTTVGTPKTSSETLPPTLTDEEWGLTAVVCQQGGYDISSLAGDTVCLVEQDITQLCQENPACFGEQDFTQLCQGSPAHVVVIMLNGVVECVFKGVNNSTPGILSVNDPSCHN
jgi:hypothetical protein